MKNTPYWPFNVYQLTCPHTLPMLPYLISTLPLIRPGKVLKLPESVSSSTKEKLFQPQGAVARVHLENLCKELSKVPGTWHALRLSLLPPLLISETPWQTNGHSPH